MIGRAVMIPAAPVLSAVLFYITWGCTPAGYTYSLQVNDSIRQWETKMGAFGAGGKEKPEYIPSLSVLVCSSCHNKIPQECLS